MPTEVLKYSLRDGEAIIKSYDDVEPILEHNKELRSQPQKSDWGRHIGTIPNIIIVKWLNAEWERGHDIKPFSAEFNEMIAQKLRDPDWAYLRTDR